MVLLFGLGVLLQWQPQMFQTAAHAQKSDRSATCARWLCTCNGCLCQCQMRVKFSVF